MSFLGIEPSPTAAEENTIENDGWFPAVDLVRLRNTARLDGTVTADRLRHSTLSALLGVNRQLEAFKALHVAAGHAGLGDVPSMKAGGISALVIHYERAVYCSVQADLIERYRDFDTTGAGDQAAEKMEQRLDDLRRDVSWAISDVTGRRRTTVELI